MTSNLGSQYAFDDDPEHREEHYMSKVHKFFKPEFILTVLMKSSSLMHWVMMY